MVFGKIDYLNLLPFYVFLKKNCSLRFNAILNYKKSYPSKINALFNKRKIDSAFISSIKAKNKDCFKIGIVANKEVLSVLIKLGKYEKDIESATSNILAKILKLNGQVVIGDKALRFYKNKDYLDLASIWYEKYKLPFVFAIFCVNKNKIFYNKLVNRFLNKKIFIPQYILKKYSKKTYLTKKEILYYLTKIYYKIDYKEEKGLKKFYKLGKKYEHI